MKRALWFLPFFCLSGCIIPYSNNTYRHSSPLHRFVGKNPRDEEVRVGILNIIPLGTPRAQVEAAIRKNFDAKIQVGNRIWPMGPHARSRPYIRVPLHVHIPYVVGYDSTDADFIFDETDRLLDMQVLTDMNYL